MGWGDRSWMCSPNSCGSHMSFNIPRSDLGFGGGGVCPLPDGLQGQEVEAGGSRGVFVCVEFERRERYFWGLVFSFWGWRERCSPQIHGGLRCPHLAGILCGP